jgi:hypothetical protein
VARDRGYPPSLPGPVPVSLSLRPLPVTVSESDPDAVPSESLARARGPANPSRYASDSALADASRLAGGEAQAWTWTRPPSLSPSQAGRALDRVSGSGPLPPDGGS